uniref:CRAL-TRIO domain-containing protein n=1 Tax=Heterorhabditis bacteriophora TaxID=37862 RepID=A0A1I7X0F0_HETBA
MPPIAQPEYYEDKVKEVRLQVADIIHPRYDTYFNILRWLQSNQFNVSKTIHTLRTHLKWRRERKLDEDARGLQYSAITEEFAPLSIVGANRSEGDRIIVIDQAGRIDIGGVMKSIQPTQYLHQLYRNFEKILKLLMEVSNCFQYVTLLLVSFFLIVKKPVVLWMEERCSVQCYVHYVFDLEGLSFDPTLLSIINVRKVVKMQQRRQMSRLNRSAISPFIPEHSRDKIVLTGKAWQKELTKLCDNDHLPERYGGTIPDSMVLRDPKPVPKDLFWKPRDDYPALNTMHRVSIPAGQAIYDNWKSSKFRSGEKDLKNKSRGKPPVLVDDDVLRTLVGASPSRTLSSLAEELGVCCKIVGNHLKNMGKVKTFNR